MKALGTGWGPVGWREVEVLPERGGRPGVRLRGRAAERAAALGISAWYLSIAHSRTLAVAQAIAWAGPRREAGGARRPGGKAGDPESGGAGVDR